MNAADVVDSPLWYRVSELRPRLRGHVRIQRREARGQTWYLLIDPNTGRFHRVNRAAYEFVGRINGRDTVGQLWSHVHERLGESAPTQGDVVQLLSQLAQAELISADALPEFGAFLKAKRKRELEKKLAAVNPLAFKVPLFDPSRGLNALQPVSRALFTVWGLFAWLALTLLGLGFAVAHAEALTHAVKTHSLSTGFLISMWVAYPFVKLIHEFGHAMAVRVWGGQVKEIGITLMLLTPVPYVDASAATQFAQRHRRVLVGAVGIMVELAIAALALFVWLAASAPWLQQGALAVMLLCSLSTVVFNANPLARFDGYYVLSDLLEVPNLARRANAVVTGFVTRLLGAAPAAPAASTPTETAMLAAYSIAAYAYRWVVGLAIVSWLHESYPLLAAAVALLLLWGLVVWPAWRGFGYLLWDARLNGKRTRAMGIGASFAMALVVALGVVPAPSVTVQQGVVWLPEHAVIRVPTDGTLTALHAKAGEHVRAGTTIAAFENLELASEREAAYAKQVQLDVQYYEAMLIDPLRAQQLAAERATVQTEVTRLDERLATLSVAARIDGTLVLPRSQESDGHFYAQGRELGYVLPNEPVLVKVALTEAQAALVRAGSAQVGVRLADRHGTVHRGRIERETPGITRELPSAALGASAGGPIATDPGDKTGRRTLQPVTLVDVRLDELRSAPMGMRAWVRFEHTGEPLVAQWARALRQLFLRSLGARQ